MRVLPHRLNRLCHFVRSTSLRRTTNSAEHIPAFLISHYRLMFVWLRVSISASVVLNMYSFAFCSMEQDNFTSNSVSLFFTEHLKTAYSHLEHFSESSFSVRLGSWNRYRLTNLQLLAASLYRNTAMLCKPCCFSFSMLLLHWPPRCYY